MESRKRYGIGILASAVALIAPVAALTPGAQAAGSFTTCADKPVKFKIEDGSGGTRPYTVVVKAISTICSKPGKTIKYGAQGG